MNRASHDLLVVGAGPSGCVVAERAAELLGLDVLVIDRRKHLAGNCFDRAHSSGVAIHEYGPHYFRTGSASLVAYLTRFTDWLAADYRVVCELRGEHYPFPINLTTLEKFFGLELTPVAAAALLQAKAWPIAAPTNSEEYVLSRVGRELYEAFYLDYTTKQWGRHPRQLDPSVCGRIPVRLNRDHRYTDAPFQKMPARGYTEMFRRMLDHPRIQVRLGTDFDDLRRSLPPPRRATVYCGPLDEYFDHRLGRLPWRSLHFEHVARDVELSQPCVQINFPDRRPYTRAVEIKHVTGQRHPATVVTYEFPQAGGEPYYPVPGPESRGLYERYRELAQREEREHKVFFTGRMATYRYMNSDEAMLLALETFERLRGALAR